MIQASGATWNEAYGSYLGTVMVCAFATICISFLPTRVLKRLFPTYVAGQTVMLVGIYLCGVEITNWGAFLPPCVGNLIAAIVKTILYHGRFLNCRVHGCRTNCLTKVQAGLGSQSAHGCAGGGFSCTNGPDQDLCSGNGMVMLPFGAIQYVVSNISSAECVPKEHPCCVLAVLPSASKERGEILAACERNCNPGTDTQLTEKSPHDPLCSEKTYNELH